MYANLPTNDIQDGNLSWSDETVQAHIEELMQCPWYKCEEGYLYIVTPGEVEGPDNEMIDVIVKALHSGVHEEMLDWAIKDLTHVDSVLRRFNPVDGFYHT